MSDRDYADWFNAIGPEELDRETVRRELEAAGFERLDEDNFESDPVAESDMPDWTAKHPEHSREAQLAKEEYRKTERRAAIDRMVDEELTPEATDDETQ